MTSLDTDFWMLQSRPDRQMEKSLVTGNPAMAACLRLARRCAGANCPVMITGESGAGKFLVASYLHRHSPRSRRPLVTLDCSLLREGGVRDALFGPGDSRSPGEDGMLYEAAGGTLILRGAEQLSRGMQRELLGLLHEYARMDPGDGGTGLGRNLGIRLVSTSSAVGNMAASGLFLEDLFFALGEVTLRVPPLRGRREDVEYLAGMAIEAAHRNGASVRTLSRSAKDFLRRYSFPGNISELFLMVERAARVCDGEIVYMEDLNLLADETEGTDGAPLLPLAEVERRQINRALLHTAWKRSAAARILHISETTLNRKIRIYGLERDGI